MAKHTTFCLIEYNCMEKICKQIVGNRLQLKFIVIARVPTSTLFTGHDYLMLPINQSIKVIPSISKQSLMLSTCTGYISICAQATASAFFWAALSYSTRPYKAYNSTRLSPPLNSISVPLPSKHCFNLLALSKDSLTFPRGPTAATGRKCAGRFRYGKVFTADTVLIARCFCLLHVSSTCALLDLMRWRRVKMRILVRKSFGMTRMWRATLGRGLPRR